MKFLCDFGFHWSTRKITNVKPAHAKTKRTNATRLAKPNDSQNVTGAFARVRFPVRVLTVPDLKSRHTRRKHRNATGKSKIPRYENMIAPKPAARWRTKPGPAQLQNDRPPAIGLDHRNTLVAGFPQPKQRYRKLKFPGLALRIGRRHNSACHEHHSAERRGTGCVASFAPDRAGHASSIRRCDRGHCRKGHR